MKKTFLFFLFLINGFVSQCQSIHQTTNWVLNQYELYERDINRDRELIIADGVLFYKIEIDDGYGFWQQFPLKEVTEIEIVKEYWDSEKEIGWSKIYLYFEPYVSKIKEFDRSKTGEYEVSDVPGCGILLGSKFIDDNNAHLMEQALIRLIKWNGGSAEIIKSLE